MRGELDHGGQGVVAVGGEAGLACRRQDKLHHRMAGNLAVFHRIEGGLDGIDRGGDDHAGRQVGVESRGALEGQVQLGRPTAGADETGAVEKARIQMAGADEGLEGRARRDGGDDDRGGQRLARGEDDAGGAVALDQHAGDGLACAQIDPGSDGRCRHGVGQLPHATAWQQDVGAHGELIEKQDQRVGRTGAGPCPQGRIKSQKAAQPVVGQIILDHIGDVDQDHPQELAEIVAAKGADAKAEAGEAAPFITFGGKARRRQGPERRQNPGKGAEFRVKGGEGRGVGARGGSALDGEGRGAKDGGGQGGVKA